MCTVHGLQAALHAARAIVQPRQADAVHAREHAVLVQAADVDAVGRAVEVHPGFGALTQVAPVLDLKIVHLLAVGAGLPGGRCGAGSSTNTPAVRSCTARPLPASNRAKPSFTEYVPSSPSVRRCPTSLASNSTVTPALSANRGRASANAPAGMR
ncbi:hypothetical protein G6F59_015960 [Rhizopus arrhizus]|nr:hypothetical protein G6F59_015960 [Rhizopus arrhizus]